MKRLFIFDLDGMILDTIEDSFYCVNQVLKEFGIKPYDVDLKTMHYPTFRKYLNENNAGKETPQKKGVHHGKIHTGDRPCG